MITFQKIRFKNLLSYGDSFTEFDFLGSNSTLIVGSNGSGKSVLLDALTLSLFGKPFRKIKKQLLVSHVNESECVVEILFEVNGNQYKIKRSMKPNKFEISERISTNSIRFDDWDSNTMLDQTITGDQQKFLELNILKMNYFSFTQVVVLGKAKYSPFFELDNAKRRAMVEEMLSSTIFGQMNKLLKSRILITNNELMTIGWEIDKVKSEIKSLTSYIDELEIGNNVLVSDIEKEISEYDAELELLAIKYDELVDIHNELDVKSKALSKSPKALNNINGIKSKLQSKSLYIDSDIQFFIEHESCPKCSQILSEETKRSSIEKLNELSKIQADKISQVDAKINELTELVDKFDELSKLQTSNWTETNKISINIKHLEQQKSNSISKIKKISNNFDTSKHKSDLLVSNALYAELLEKKACLLDTESVSLDLLKILGDDGAKLLLIKKYIPIFNKYINYYLTKMGLDISFSIDESFNEKILARYRDKSSYNSFSEGEKLRIDLAMLLTWRTVSQLRNSVNTNLLVLDEIFDSSLDVEGVDGFIESMGDFSDMNVIVISHTPDKLAKWAKRSFLAEKRGNFSKLIESHYEV